MSPQPVRVALLPLSIFFLSALTAIIFTYPLYTPFVKAGYAAIILFFILGYAKPYWGLIAWLFCVPWFSFAKWTGAMVVEEFDLALWGYCLGISIYVFRFGLPCKASNIKWHKGILLIVLLALCWQIAAIFKGYQLLPANSAIYFTNYEDQAGPMRIGKALFSALCFYVCCRYLARDWPRFQRALVLGFSFGALAAVLGCLFERWYFTGLLNLTTDYRTTSWFWEMHTGGATLDAYLALSLPFVMLGLIRSANLLERSLFALLLAAYSYVALTTFSRGVYLAVLIVGVLFIVLNLRQYKAHAVRCLPVNKTRFYGMLAVCVIAIIASLLLFPFGGYRVLLAISGLVLLLLIFIARLSMNYPLAAIIGAFAAIGIMFLTYLLLGIAKPVYLFYALCWFATIALFFVKHKANASVSTELGLGLFSMLLAGLSIAICWYWSDYQLSTTALPALALLLIMPVFILLPSKRTAAMPLEACAALWALVSGLALVLAMFFNSSYIDVRFSTSDKDLMGRFEHWDKTIQAMPGDTDIWLGSGVGRFVPLNRARGEQEDQVAILNLLPLQQGNVLYLKSGSHMHGYGELFRITQQITRPVGEVALQIKLRHNTDVQLLAEICDKQLLYHGKCTRGYLDVKGNSDGVQTYLIQFKDNPFSVVILDSLISKTFSLAINKRDKEIVIDSLQLIDSHQSNLLKNGDFSEQMRFWFFSSDRHHMPYHVKGLWPMQLFEMGLVGLGLFSLLTLLILWRQMFVIANFSDLGSTVALSLLGILAVGLFDSVIDGGRMAMLYFILLLLTASIKPQPSSPVNGLQ